VSKLKQRLDKIFDACNWAAVDRAEAKRKADLIALKQKAAKWVHPRGFDKEKWCWSNADNTDGGFDLDTKEQAIQDAFEHTARTKSLLDWK